jgi:hypothetical protein
MAEQMVEAFASLQAQIESDRKLSSEAILLTRQEAAAATQLASGQAAAALTQAIFDNVQHNKEQARKTDEMNNKFIQEMTLQRNELDRQQAVAAGREQRVPLPGDQGTARERLGPGIDGGLSTDLMRGPQFTGKGPTISRAGLSGWDLFDRAMSTYLRLKGVRNDSDKISWYWMGLHTNLHEQAVSFDPELMATPYVPFAVWREQLKLVFSTPADTAMARLNFNQIRQSTKEPIQEYHSRLLVQWKRTSLDPHEELFVERFNDGLVSQELRREILRTQPKSPQDCLIAARNGVALLVSAPIGHKMDSEEHLKGLYSQRLETNQLLAGKPLKQPSYGTAKTTDEDMDISALDVDEIWSAGTPLFGELDGDDELQYQEEDYVRAEWEGDGLCAISGGPALRPKECWSCGSSNHLKAECPARRPDHAKYLKPVSTHRSGGAWRGRDQGRGGAGGSRGSTRGRGAGYRPRYSRPAVSELQAVEQDHQDAGPGNF